MSINADFYISVSTRSLKQPSPYAVSHAQQLARVDTTYLYMQYIS